MSSTKADLRQFVAESQEEDWGDLLLALDRAVNGVWSIECDGIAARIRRAARLVGPTPWLEVDWGTYTSGLYRAILDGIDFVQPTEAEVIETDELMKAHRNHRRVVQMHQAAIHITEKGINGMYENEKGQFEPCKTIEEMQAEVVAWTIRKGWYDPNEITDLAPVGDKVNPTFGEAMALITSEASEALEAFREWGLEDSTQRRDPATHRILDDDGLLTRSWCKAQGYAGPCPSEECPSLKPEGVGSEFADILIRLFHYAHLFGVDLRFEYERKMAHNEKRPFRHGEKAL